MHSRTNAAILYIKGADLIMEQYEELLKSLESCGKAPSDCEPSVLKRTAEAIEALKAAVAEKQKLLDRALGDLAKDSECKHCANVGQCSTRCVERNLAYGGCGKWQWKGVAATEIAS